MFFGIPVCDDPTDTYRDLGLSIDDDVLIQMGMEGTTCGFDSRCPTLGDMASFKRITVSHETGWDTSTVHFNVSSVEKENRYTVHAVLQFDDFSNPYICDIALEHQSATTKRFVDTVKIIPRSIENFPQRLD